MIEVQKVIVAERAHRRFKHYWSPFDYGSVKDDRSLDEDGLPWPLSSNADYAAWAVVHRRKYPRIVFLDPKDVHASSEAYDYDRCQWLGVPYGSKEHRQLMAWWDSGDWFQREAF